MASDTYASLQAAHATLPSFTPLLATSTLPYLAFFSLMTVFTLAFFFTTLPKPSVPVAETVTATVASAFAGIGIVALACSVGIYV